MASALLAASALGVLTWQAPTAWQALAWCWFAWCGMALAAIDVAVHRLPRPIVATATAGVAVCLLAATLLDRQPHILIRAVLAAVGLGLLYLLAVILPRNGMGLGDAALAVPVGLTTGWISLTTTALATLAAILTAGLASGALLATGRATRGDDIAYGPFMVFGALVALLASG